jgi:DNA-binding IclR family transcriptional regulator
MDQEVGPTREAGGVQVIARAAAVLRALGPDGMSLGKLAQATGLPRSTVQRIVDALAAENFVEFDKGGVLPGWGLQQLARRAHTDIAVRVRPYLEALFSATHETVDISVGHGREVAFLDRIISDQELRVVPITDRPRPLHAMANGKAILSCLTDAQVTSLVGSKALKLTPATRIDLPGLLSELGDIRITGFAYDREEHAPGVCAVGASINIAGLRPHAISIAIPAHRFEAGLAAYRLALRDCQSQVEQNLSGAADLAQAAGLGRG